MTVTTPTRTPAPPAPDEVAALIEEARRRARRRRVGYAAAALVVAGSVLAVFGLANRGGGRGLLGGADAAPSAPVVRRVAHANGLLAMVEQNDLAVVKPDGSGLRRLSTCPVTVDSCDFAWYAWSPDGKQLAFLRGHIGGALTSSDTYVYVVKPDGTGRRRLARCGDCGFGQDLSWSPDSRWIAFAGGVGVSVVDVFTGVQRRVSMIGGNPAWSPDGSRIAFVFANALYTIKPDGSGLARLAVTDGDVADPAWSPDATRIAFDAMDRVYVVDANGSNLTLLVDGSPGSGPGAPSWSPDGARIVYFSTSTALGGYGAEVWIAQPDGTDRRRLYHSDCCDGIWSAPVWSPDGKMIAIGPHADHEILLIDADGTLRRTVAGYARAIAWQPLPEGP